MCPRQRGRCVKDGLFIDVHMADIGAASHYSLRVKIQGWCSGQTRVKGFERKRRKEACWVLFIKEFNALCTICPCERGKKRKGNKNRRERGGTAVFNTFLFFSFQDLVSNIVFGPFSFPFCGSFRVPVLGCPAGEAWIGIPGENTQFRDLLQRACCELPSPGSRNRTGEGGVPWPPLPIAPTLPLSGTKIMWI